MKIGNLKLDNNIFLAPMAGVTDMPFRVLCREMGCGLVYTEMVSAKGMRYGDERSFKLTEIDPGEKPAAIQIFGSDPHIMSESARMLNDSRAGILDINMGCPTPKITKNGEGSALMLRPELIGDIIEAVVKASDKPVTVKIRKGWDDERVNAVQVARIAQESGASAVTVHGRTREQFYSGKADWEIIRKVKEAVNIPVIGNGDVTTPQAAVDMLRVTGCDGVMIGRGAQGNPWIFRNVVRYMETGEIPPPPGAREKIDTIIRHMNALVELKGEHIGISEMRKHIAWYVKGMRNATYVKEKVFRTNSIDEIITTLRENLLNEDVRQS